MSNIRATVQDGNNVLLQVTPQPRIDLRIDRSVSGPPGPAGPNSIGGYPISITAAANMDALMFLDDEWVNIPQVEITDGGNY